MGAPRFDNPVVATLIALRDRIRPPAARELSAEDRLDGRTALVTGANRGLGRAVAVQLAERGARVLLACRSDGAAARADIERRGGVAELLAVDLSNLRSVHRLADGLAERGERVDVLVLNAGVVPNRSRATTQGVEIQIGVNYLANVLLASRLLEDGVIDNDVFTARRDVDVVGLVRPRSDRRGLAGLEVQLAEGDILDPRSLDAAARGCDVMFRCASAFAIWARHEDDILRPAIEGTENALRAAAAANVDRVVLASSVATVGAGDSADAAPRDADTWADDLTVPYYLAKQRAERRRGSSPTSSGSRWYRCCRRSSSARTTTASRRRAVSCSTCCADGVPPWTAAGTSSTCATWPRATCAGGERGGGTDAAARRARRHTRGGDRDASDLRPGAPRLARDSCPRESLERARAPRTSGRAVRSCGWLRSSSPPGARAGDHVTTGLVQRILSRGRDVVNR